MFYLEQIVGQWRYGLLALTCIYTFLVFCYILVFTLLAKILTVIKLAKALLFITSILRGFAFVAGIKADGFTPL